MKVAGKPSTEVFYKNRNMINKNYVFIVFVITTFILQSTVQEGRPRIQRYNVFEFYLKGFGNERNKITIYEWDTLGKSIDSAINDVFHDIQLPKLKGTEEIIQMHISRALLLRNFRRQELLNYIENLAKQQRPIMFIQLTEFVPSFFRTPEGWTLLGKSLFNIFEPLPLQLYTSMEHKLNRLIVPWHGIREQCIAKPNNN